MCCWPPNLHVLYQTQNTHTHTHTPKDQTGAQLHGFGTVCRHHTRWAQLQLKAYAALKDAGRSLATTSRYTATGLQSLGHGPTRHTTVAQDTPGATAKDSSAAGNTQTLQPARNKAQPGGATAKRPTQKTCAQGPGLFYYTCKNLGNNHYHRRQGERQRRRRQCAAVGTAGVLRMLCGIRTPGRAPLTNAGSQQRGVLTKMTTAASQDAEDCPHLNTTTQNPHTLGTHTKKGTPLATPAHSVPAPPLPHTTLKAHTC